MKIVIKKKLIFIITIVLTMLALNRIYGDQAYAAVGGTLKQMMSK